MLGLRILYRHYLGWSHCIVVPALDRTHSLNPRPNCFITDVVVGIHFQRRLFFLLVFTDHALVMVKSFEAWYMENRTFTDTECDWLVLVKSF